MTLRVAATPILGLMLASALGSAVAQPQVALSAPPLPPADARLAASADECAVWQREMSFARTVEAHDAVAFVSHIHPDAVFDAGQPELSRGPVAIAASWKPLIEGRTMALRWRAGIVNIGGRPDVALSRGPYVLEIAGARPNAFRVGFYSSVWVRVGLGSEWRVLFDGSASTPLPMADRAAADAWVRAQPMSDCDRR